jgi:hypothetical protein
MAYDVYTQSDIQSYIFSANLRALITAFSGFFCIFAILRYSSKSMESGYRFHLLNMTCFILLSDLTILLLLKPQPVFPMHAVCFVGEINDVLLNRFGLSMMTKIELVSCLRFNNGRV